MNSVGGGFAQALSPWWMACARLLSGDDPGEVAPEERAPARQAGEPAGDGDAPPEVVTFWRGDDAALAAIYRAHARALLGAARSMVGPADAESVVQEVFVELLRNPELRRRFSGGSLPAWLGAIARRKGLEHLRRTGRTRAASDASAASSPSAAEAVDPSPEPRLEARDFLLRFLKTGVPAEQAEFFQRRFLDGQTQVQVAAALGIPRSTLEGWEHRLAERLRRFIWEDAP